MLELDGDFLAGLVVDGGVDISEVAGAEVLVLEEDVAPRALADVGRDGVFRALVVGHGERGWGEGRVGWEKG